jgi:hypothetical protein
MGAPNRVSQPVGANLRDPENVKQALSMKKWKNGTKMQTAYAYNALTKMLKITWDPPRYRQEEYFPFTPDKKEVDMLIHGSLSKQMYVFLQTLKETMAEPTEALRIPWIDISGNIITINFPVKGLQPRQLQVPNTLIATLYALPRKTE